MTESQVQAFENLARNYRFDFQRRHSHKVAALAASVFDQLQIRNLLRHLHIPERRTLIAACYAHGIGGHGEVPAEEPALPPDNRPALAQGDPGLSSFETVRTLLKNPPAQLQREPLSAVDRSAFLYAILWHNVSSTYLVDDEPLVDRFYAHATAGILRLADALDSPLRPAVGDVRIVSSADYLRLLLRTTDTLEDEIPAAQDQSDILESVTGKRIVVQEIVDR